MWSCVFLHATAYDSFPTATERYAFLVKSANQDWTTNAMTSRNAGCRQRRISPWFVSLMRWTRNFVNAYIAETANGRGKSIMALYKCSTYCRPLGQFTIWDFYGDSGNAVKCHFAMTGLASCALPAENDVAWYTQCSMRCVSNRTHVECTVPRIGRTRQLFLTSTMLLSCPSVHVTTTVLHFVRFHNTHFRFCLSFRCRLRIQSHDYSSRRFRATCLLSYNQIEPIIQLGYLCFSTAY